MITYCSQSARYHTSYLRRSTASAMIQKNRDVWAWPENLQNSAVKGLSPPKEFVSYNFGTTAEKEGYRSQPFEWTRQ